MYKFETSNFHRLVRGSNVHRGSSAGQSDAKTHLCDKKNLVAPIRHTTIPKLELQSAVYGVHIRSQVLKEYDVKIDKISHWKDSSTVLQ